MPGDTDDMASEEPQDLHPFGERQCATSIFFFFFGILLEMKIREFKKGKHSMNFAYYHRYCVSTKCIKKNNLKEATKWHAESFLGKTTFFYSSLIIPARIPGL